MSIKTIFIAVFILTRFCAALLGQHLDFDSLYKHNKVIKEEFKKNYISKDLFSSDEVMNITIESDFKNLVKQKFKDEYQPAMLKYYYNETY